jgi:hypothetical protein
MKLLLLVLALLSVGCNGGGGGGGSSAPAPEVTNVADTYTGLWAACVNDTGNGISTLYSYSISTNSVVSSYVYYSGLGCQVAGLVYDEKFVSSVTKSGNNYITSLVGVSSTSLSSGDVTYNNTNTYCGYSNWVLNAPKDILSRNCEGNTNSVGDSESYQMVKSGANLLVTGTAGTIEVYPMSSPAFNHAGTAIPDNTYSLFNGDYAYQFILSGASYTVSVYDIPRGVYYSETGSYSINQNIISFTMASETPNCGNTPGSSWALYYSPSALALIFKNVSNDILTAESHPVTALQFRNSYVGSGFVQGCL